MSERYADPSDPLNGSKHHTGKPCIAWSKFWCQPCNAKRMDRISASLERVLYEPDGVPSTPAAASQEETEQPKGGA
jgi:hypothetical protein